jgi:hypothetical protein
MPSNTLTDEARQENANTLASILGIGVESAAEALDLQIVITAETASPCAASVAEDLHTLLSRTVKHVSFDTIVTPAVEILIGATTPRTIAPPVHVSIDQEHAVINSIPTVHGPCHPVPRILALLIACYAAGAALHRALKGSLPFTPPDPFVFRFNELGLDLNTLADPIDVERMYLAGAGAIGNGFLWAARHLNFRGHLQLVDDDIVSAGNLNRQIWFSVEDVDHFKVDRLKLKAQPYFPHLCIGAHRSRLQALPDRNEGPWLHRLIVAVDSRRARRALQNEFPGEVFDASTTDIREVVIHHHRQLTENACLSCIYEPDQEEYSREQHIADHLGLPVNEVRSERISPETAAIIATQFTTLDSIKITGMAYDSLFKRLCAEGSLGAINDKRIVAPFAFVSVLAGTLLALEIVRRIGRGHTHDFNYWRLSPWYPPLARRRVLRPRQPNCEFCGRPVFSRLNSSLWSSSQGRR